MCAYQLQPTRGPNPMKLPLYVRICAAIALILASSPAFAQTTVPTYIEGATGSTKQGIGVTILQSGTTGNAAIASTNLSGTTSATPSTYTTIQASTTSRRGCTVLNTSVNAEIIRIGGAALFPLAASQTFSCAVQGVDAAISDLIEISSSVASSAYTATFQ